MVGVDAGQPVPVSERLQGWDYQSSVVFELRPTVNWSEFAKSTGIFEADAVDLIGMVQCRATNRRFIVSAPVLAQEEGPALLRIVVPRGEVAKQVELSAHAVLRAAREGPGLGVARRVGSRLGHSDVTRITLEGEGSRFPTEVASFRALGLEEALWSVQVRPSALDAAFVGSTRLLINSDLPASTPLLVAEATDSAAFRFLQIDIVRQMVHATAALQLPEADLISAWDEGTFGRAVQEATRGLLGSDLVTCVSYVRSDTSRLERLLHEAFRPWEAT